ncbi:hypothetical protein TOPH_02011 [Tolypocladium ophioglossoides CBS 100239]|uniref:Uncharacterized protein n=1 Tax=Tolypocladium ophioglossoides (strain CBS 100239) TaxID=1163406 RepID=A0A0L0NFW6_TOLOC|nr:hypothetical protein TOPH_02011 [Tolypocladium ophioglossoides CBS 100239]
MHILGGQRIGCEVCQMVFMLTRHSHVPTIGRRREQSGSRGIIGRDHHPPQLKPRSSSPFAAIDVNIYLTFGPLLRHLSRPLTIIATKPFIHGSYESRLALVRVWGTEPICEVLVRIPPEKSWLVAPTHRS